MTRVPHGLGRCEHAGVVIERELAEKGSVVDEPDQGPEHDGAKSGNQAYDNSKKRQTNKTDSHGQLDLHQKLISVPPEHPAEFGERQHAARWPKGYRN